MTTAVRSNSIEFGTRTLFSPGGRQRSAKPDGERRRNLDRGVETETACHGFYGSRTHEALVDIANYQGFRGPYGTAFKPHSPTSTTPTRRLQGREVSRRIPGRQVAAARRRRPGHPPRHRRRPPGSARDRASPERAKMKASDIEEASRQYAAGDSLATVAAFFGVDATTVRRELHRVGVAIRVRRGWAP